MSGDLIRVLIVDDDAGARSLHGQFVASTQGFTVVGSVGTGGAAVSRVQAGGVDLLLLDMRLPDISGVEVLRRIRALNMPSPDVCIVSSARDQITVRQALAAHIDGYLIKPFTREALQDRLTRYQNERRTNTSQISEHLFAQGEIDRLFTAGQIALTRSPASGPPSAGPAPNRSGVQPDQESPAPALQLPKGVSEVTLNRVLAALDPSTARSAVEVAQHCGISRATARRYLDFLVGEGVIDLAHLYGRRGRPEVLYRLALTQLRHDD